MRNPQRAADGAKAPPAPHPDNAVAALYRDAASAGPGRACAVIHYRPPRFVKARAAVRFLRSARFKPWAVRRVIRASARHVACLGRRTLHANT